MQRVQLSLVPIGVGRDRNDKQGRLEHEKDEEMERYLDAIVQAETTELWDREIN